MFDIKDAVPGARFETRDGREAVILVLDEEHAPYVVVVGYIKVPGFEDLLTSWTAEGYGRGVFAVDLVGLVKPKFVQWLNLYGDSRDPEVYNNAADAVRDTHFGHVACVRIEYEEGQFDD